MSVITIPKKETSIYYLKYWEAQLKTRMSRNKIEGSWKSGINGAEILNLAKALGMTKDVGDIMDLHPYHKDRVQQMRDNWKVPVLSLRRIAVGDSLYDMARAELPAIPNFSNLAMSGLWHYQAEQMLLEVIKYLDSNVINRNLVKVIYIGSLAGNPLMAGQSYETTWRRCVSVYNFARANFPGARIVISTLPPTYSIWANLHRWRFESDVWNWVVNDSNAVLVSFKRFGGLLPNMIESSDTTHLTASGNFRFNDLLEDAATCPARTFKQ